MTKEITRKQLMAAVRLSDKQQRTDRRDEIHALAKAMTARGFDFYPWELEEVKRFVHGAYGRMKLS